MTTLTIISIINLIINNQINKMVKLNIYDLPNQRAEKFMLKKIPKINGLTYNFKKHFNYLFI